MKIYNLVESAQLLGVDPATLRRWRAAAGGAGLRGSADGRRVWLSRVELAALARAHGRVLLDAAPGADFAELAREVAELRARVAALEVIVCERG
jgi:hypothetical protein